MLKIGHRPHLDTHALTKFYSAKDGVPVKYVMTSDKGGDNVPREIMYRETPHPEFGNRYFGVFRTNGEYFIGNADWIEDEEILVGKLNGYWLYSKYRHDYVGVENGAIDGGRAYHKIVGSPETKVVKVEDGEFVEV